MQAWHDQEYFAQDLPMNRTQIDTEWIYMGELTQRATGPKAFLPPIITPVPPGPPGLARRLENLNDPLLQRDSSPFGAPHQPGPIGSLRTSTLDSSIYSETSNPLSMLLGRIGALISTVLVVLPTPTSPPLLALMVSFDLPLVECY